MNERRLVYALWWGLWALTAIPMAIWSIAVGEIPMSPSFDSHTTIEGIALWVAFFAWVYLTPIALIGVRGRFLAARASNSAESK